MRVKILRTTLISCFSLLSCGLIYTQVVKGPAFTNLAESNRIRLHPIEGSRGIVYDRNGQVLAGSRLSFDVVVIPQEMTKPDLTFTKLSELLDTPVSSLKERYEENYLAPFAPVPVVADIEREKAIAIEVHRIFLPGVMIQTRPTRDYPYGALAGHLLGFLGEIDKQELQRLEDYGYRMKDRIGRSGVERFYDSYLRAEAGGMQLEVDNRGRMVRILGVKEPHSGMDIQLTIDLRIQKFLEERLQGHTGAAVAIESTTGEVLAIVSAPSFDPNTFVKFKQRGKIWDLLRDRQRPLLNRAISGLYPPGSTFKVITATSGLDTNRLTKHSEFACSGYYKLGDRVFKCWNDTGHGSQNLRSGLITSCNVFFFQFGRIVGPDNISSFAGTFELGKKTGIDLPGESRGLVPSRKWKKDNLALAWFEGDTLNFAIGQSYLMVTPIQMLRAVNAIANGGYLVTPIVVKKAGGIEIASTKQRRLPINPKALQAVKEGLDGVVEEPNGTGARAKTEGIKIGAKTGTAQTTKGAPHGWFIGYVPAGNPKVSFVIFLEHSGSGGGLPAEIAHDLVLKLREYKII